MNIYRIAGAVVFGLTLVSLGILFAARVLAASGNLLTVVKGEYPSTEIYEIDLTLGLHFGISSRFVDGFSPTWNTAGDVAYESYADGQYEIYVQQTDVFGHRATMNVSNDPHNDFGPVWSTDGRLAFDSNRNGSWQIFVWDSRDPHRALLNVTPDVESLRILTSAWSEDGWLAFNNINYNDEAGMYVWDGTTTTLVFQELGENYIGEWSWSRNHQLAFTINPQEDIYIWTSSGEAGCCLTNLTNGIGVASEPTWGLQGQLAFKVDHRDRSEIYIWDGQSFSSPAFTRIGNYSFNTPFANFTWSTSGKLAFVANDPQTSIANVYVWDSADSSITNISNDPVGAMLPTWNRCHTANCAEQLAFQSARGSDYEIYIWDGINLINVSYGPVVEYRWRP